MRFLASSLLCPCLELSLPCLEVWPISLPHLSAFFNSTNDVRPAFTHLGSSLEKKRSSDIGFPIDEKNLFALALFPPLWFGCQRKCKKNCITWEVFFFALRWNELLCWRILAMSWINYRISCSVVVVFFFNLIFKEGQVHRKATLKMSLKFVIIPHLY